MLWRFSISAMYVKIGHANQMLGVANNYIRVVSNRTRTSESSAPQERSARWLDRSVISQLVPMGHIHLSACFAHEITPLIHLHIICRCLHPRTEELSTCDRHHLAHKV